MAATFVVAGTTVTDRPFVTAISSVLTVSGGTDNLLVVAIMCAVGPTITSVVWDPAGANQSFTSAGSPVASGGSTASNIFLYYLINPTAGAAKNVTATFSGSSGDAGIVSAHFQGADQTTPLRAGSYNSNTGNASTLALTITSQVGDLTTTAVVGDGDQTPSTDKTLIGSQGLTGFGPCIGLDRATGAASVTHTWSNIRFGNSNGAVGFSIAASAAAVVSDTGKILKRTYRPRPFAPGIAR